MAAKFPSASKVQLKPRKGHDMAWSCDEHGEPIKFYCKEHKVPVCQSCAIKDHQKPCHLENIGDVILEMGSELEDILQELEEMKQRSKKLISEIQSSSTFVSKHLKTVNDEINSAFKEKIKSVQEKEREKIILINEKADDQIRILNDQIRIINEERENQIKSSMEKSATEQNSFEDTQAQLIADSKGIDATVGKKIEELGGKNQNNIDTMDNIGSKIKRIRQDDQAIVNEARQIIASLDERVTENVYQDIMDSLDQLKLEVQRVKFVDANIGGDDYSRIHGYIGKREIIKSIDIPPVIRPKSSMICGLISNNEVCVSDGTNNNLYVTNISSGHTDHVITGDNKPSTSCARIDSNLIVCGRRGISYRGTLDGCITLYDRQWKVVRNITIPKNAHNFMSWYSVFVDVDKDGMILAAEYGQSNIYVINPADGKIVNTITMQGKELRGGIQALSSGDIVVQTGGHEFTVISRSGEEIHVHHAYSPGTIGAHCCVDKLTNTLYITSWDNKNKLNAIDQVSCDDNQARRIVEHKYPSGRMAYSYFSPSCVITPSGNLMVCNEVSLLVYKYKFVV